MHNPISGYNYTDVKANNISAILTSLLKYGKMSRAQMATSIGVSSATMTNLAGELTEQGILMEVGKIKSSKGRPQKALQIIPESKYAVGVHLDVDTINIGLSNAFAQLIDHVSYPIEARQSWEDVLQVAAEAANKLQQDNNIASQKFMGIGVAAHGLVDPALGINITAPNMHWQDAPLRTRLEELTDLPTTVDNNVRAMALYEGLFGTARTAQTLAVVYGRIGIGSGLMVNGYPYRGAGAGAGEIGHNTVIFEGGNRCRCGKTGCLETVFSEPVLLSLVADITRNEAQGLPGETNPLRIEDVFREAAEGNQDIQALLTERVAYVGYTLANLVNIFNPEIILLGGIFTRGKGILLPEIRRIIREHAFNQLGEHVKVDTIANDHTVGMQGAAGLALDHFFYRPMLHPSHHLT